MLSSEGLASTECYEEGRLIVTKGRDVSDFPASTQVVVDTMMVVSAAILVIYVGMKVIAFIQRIWHE